MLRITVEESGAIWRLRMEGKLGGDWVTETEDAWRSAPPGKQVEVDLQSVTCFDDAGRRLLKAMHQSGARLIAKGVEMKALVDEIAGEQISTRTPGEFAT